MNIRKIRQKTIVDQVMSQIKELIASGKYNPGDKIPTELELAESFGVGRSSIREAIKIFNYMGVLESRAAKGTYVQERSNISTEALTWSLLLGQDDKEEMIDLRGAIESGCILQLTENLKNRQAGAMETVKKLESIVTSMKQALLSESREQMIEYDFQFHYTIIEDSGNTLFVSLYNTLRSFLYDEIDQSQTDYSDPSLIPEEHRALIEAFKTGDRMAAQTAYESHIRNIKTRLAHR